MRSAVDSAPHVADKAVTLGLIDGRVHRDQAAKLVVRLHEFKRQQASRCSLVSFFEVWKSFVVTGLAKVVVRVYEFKRQQASLLVLNAFFLSHRGSFFLDAL